MLEQSRVPDGRATGERTIIVNLRLLMRRGILVWLAAASLSAGCSSVNLIGEVTSRRSIRGRDIDLAKVNEIVPGTTRKQEILDRFGEPERSTDPSGNEQFTYNYIGVVERTNEKVVWAKGESRDERKQLRVVFGGDVVTGFAYTNSNEPQENVARQVGPSEVVLKTMEGLVGFTNEPNQVRLDVAKGLAAKMTLTGNGALAVAVPTDNVSPLRMRVRERFASANPGTEFTTTATAGETAVAVKQGLVVVRTRTGCERVEAGSQKAVQAVGAEAAATAHDIRFPVIHYEFKADTPFAESAPFVDCVGDLLGDYPDVRVRIEGHSDNIGTSEYNLALSRRRAEGVRRGLIANGVAPSRLEVKAYGRTKPVASNDTDEGRAQNRRVEFTVRAAP